MEQQDYYSKQQEDITTGVSCQFSITMSSIKKSILSLQLASLLSLLCLSSSLLFIFLYYSFKTTNFSSLSSFFSVDRNCMFLLCNGILVFLVKSSSRSSSESSIDYQVDEKVGTRIDDHERQSAVVPSGMKETRGMESGHGIEEKTGDDGYMSSVIIERNGADDHEQLVAAEIGNEEQFHEIDINVIQHGSNEYQQVEDCGEEEVEDENEAEELNRDELNKRCEDFIRKMKEGIKAEAKQQMNTAFCFTSLRNY